MCARGTNGTASRCCALPTGRSASSRFPHSLGLPEATGRGQDAEDEQPAPAQRCGEAGLQDTWGRTESAPRSLPSLPRPSAVWTGTVVRAQPPASFRVAACGANTVRVRKPTQQARTPRPRSRGASRGESDSHTDSSERREASVGSCWWGEGVPERPRRGKASGGSGGADALKQPQEAAGGVGRCGGSQGRGLGFPGNNGSCWWAAGRARGLHPGCPVGLAWGSGTEPSPRSAQAEAGSCPRAALEATPSANTARALRLEHTTRF